MKQLHRNCGWMVFLKMLMRRNYMRLEIEREAIKREKTIKG